MDDFLLLFYSYHGPMWNGCWVFQAVKISRGINPDNNKKNTTGYLSQDPRSLGDVAMIGNRTKAQDRTLTWKNSCRTGLYVTGVQRNPPLHEQRPPPAVTMLDTVDVDLCRSAGSLRLRQLPVHRVPRPPLKFTEDKLIVVFFTNIYVTGRRTFLVRRRRCRHKQLDTVTTAVKCSVFEREAYDRQTDD